MDISFVIVNWNTRDLLRNCLRSIYETVRNVDFEIIIVDNGSSDGSVSMLTDEFPGIICVENRENRGFGAANNQAFAIMTGRYALLLNTDTIVTEKTVSELFSFMETHPDAAIAAGQLLNEDGSKQNSIAHPPTLLTLTTNTTVLEYLFPRTFPSKRYEHKEPFEITSAVGACLIVRKTAMDDVGVFDERYFFFFEETDWTYRMKMEGWKIYHVPSARIYHLQGKSIGRNIRSRVEFYRSRYKFFRKWRGTLYNRVVCCVIFIRLCVNWALTFLANVATLFSVNDLKTRWIVYSQLIVWHLKGRPERYPVTTSP